MSEKTYLFLAAFFLLFIGLMPSQSLSSAGDPQLAGLIDSLGIERGGTAELDREEFELFLQYAVDKKYNLFELLNLLALQLEPRGVRFHVSGDVVRASESSYDLGTAKIYIIIPINDLVRFEFGSTFGGSENAIDVHINKPYESDFYGFGTLQEETHFGFASVSLNYFHDAFGMNAKKMFFNFPVDYLHLYEFEEVAIYLKRFPKPKREVFWAVKER